MGFITKAVVTELIMTLDDTSKAFLKRIEKHSQWMDQPTHRAVATVWSKV